MTIAAVLISVGALLVGYLALLTVSNRQPPTGPSLLILAMFIYAVAPPAVQILTYGRFRLTTKLTELTSPLAQQTLTTMGYVVALVAVCVLARPLRDGNLRLPGWLLIYAAPWMALTVSAFANSNAVSIASIVFILTGIGVASAPHAMTALPTIGRLTALLAGLSVLGGVFYPAGALFKEAADSDKSPIGDQLLAGPLLHPNTLGQTLALGAPFLLSIPNATFRRASYITVAFALLWTGSRTSMIAIVVGALCFVILRARTRGTRWFYGILAALSLAIGPYLVATSDLQSFTGRGSVWANSLLWWEESPWLGLGPKFYRVVADVTNAFGATAYHGHNIGVHVLTVGGLVGLAALVVLFVYVLHNALHFTDGQVAGLAVFPIIFVVAGWLEVPTDFYTIGSISWIAWVPLAILCQGMNGQPRSTSSPDSDFAIPRKVPLTSRR